MPSELSSSANSRFFGKLGRVPLWKKATRSGRIMVLRETRLWGGIKVAVKTQELAWKKAGIFLNGTRNWFYRIKSPGPRGPEREGRAG